MADAKTIGKRISTLRGDTRRETVCAACGISVSALTMYETGKRIPRDEVKVKLAEFFKTTVEAIFFS